MDKRPRDVREGMGAAPSVPASPALPTEITEAEQAVFEDALIQYANLEKYNTTLSTAATIPPEIMSACLDLIALTSASAYKSSSKGWSARGKRAEMRLEGMRYLTIHCKTTDSDQLVNNAGDSTGAELTGFISYLPTMESDPDASPTTFPVLYIYEIHVHPSHQKQQLGMALMRIVESLAQVLKMRKTMLTVFTSNTAAIRFYEKLGYENWDEEVVTRKKVKLRRGEKEVKPSFVILAKDMLD